MSISLEKISLISLLLVVGSCCSQKKLAEKESTSCQGIVHLAEDGCPYYIEITESLAEGISVGSKIYPIQIKDSYKKKGLKLAFNLVVSRAQSPTDCYVDGVASLSNIVVVP